MINFEVNQQVGQPVSKILWQKWLKKISQALNFKKTAEISIAVVDSPTIKRLNKIYRGKNQVTDVLSFSEKDSSSQQFHFSTENYLGEVIICYPQAVKQAKINNQPVLKELELLFIHGVLHLFGYNHQKINEKKVMKELEKKILAQR